jgi:hypothetical protein
MWSLKQLCVRRIWIGLESNLIVAKYCDLKGGFSLKQTYSLFSFVATHSSQPPGILEVVRAAVQSSILDR